MAGFRPEATFAKASLVLFAVVPLLLAVGVLELAGPEGFPLSDWAAINRGVPSFIPGLITYAALVVVHILVCIASITLSCLVLRSSPDEKWYGAIGVVVAIATAVMLPLGGPLDFTAFDLSCTFFEKFFAGTSFTEPLPGVPGGTPLRLAIYLPTILGIASVALAAGAAVSQFWQVYGQPSLADAEREALLCLAHARIKQSAYLLSLVLVTSTVSASSFFRLPLNVYALVPNLPGEKAATAFATELTIFWAAVYSLTLIAAVGMPLLLIQREVRSFLDSLKPPDYAEQARLRLASAGILSGGQEHVKLLVAFLAPFASGPITGLVQTAMS